MVYKTTSIRYIKPTNIRYMKPTVSKTSFSTKLSPTAYKSKGVANNSNKVGNVSRKTPTTTVINNLLGNIQYDDTPTAVETLYEAPEETQISEEIVVDNTKPDNSYQIIIVILSIVILALFSLSLVRLRNRSSDKKPVNEPIIYDKNKPLPTISPSLLMKHNQNLNNMQQNIPPSQVQNTSVVDMDYYNTSMNGNYNNPNAMEYNTQQQYDYDDNRISFLALGDSAIEPRQITLTLKEEVIKKSKDNQPIPLIHVNNKKAPNGEDDEDSLNRSIEEDEDDINLKAVEPLPGTIIPSKKSPQLSSTNSRFLQESQGLFKKVSKGMKTVGNRLKPNSIMSTISNSSKSSNDNRNNSSNSYTILSSPKE